MTNYGDNSVSIIDTGTYAVVNTVASTGEPFAIAVGNAARNCAYVSTARAWPAHAATRTATAIHSADTERITARC